MSRFLEDKNTRASALLFGTLTVIVTLLILVRELDFATSAQQARSLDWTGRFNDDLMGITVAIVAVLLLAWPYLRGLEFFKSAQGKRVATVVLIGMVGWTAILHMYTSRGLAMMTYLKSHDAYHYFIGPKYYKELDYFDMYDCTAVADAEGKRILRDHDKMRDLRGYGWVRVGEAKKRTNCKEKFTHERWQEFVDDVSFFVGITSTYFRERIVKDHGYNGTPFHAFVSGAIANSFTTSYATVTAACLVDIWGIFLAFFFLGVAFGWRWAALFAMFFGLSFTDRFYYIGGSFFRYSWFYTGAIGFAALQMKRYKTAGVMIALSGMLNVFPVLFFAPIGAKIIFDLVRKKGIAQRYRQFVLGAVVCSVLAGGISISHSRHVGNYQSFFENMEGHSYLLTRSRLGFAFNFIFRGEISKDSPSYGFKAKSEDLANNKFGVGLTSGLFLLLILAVVLRLEDAQATILGGFALFFTAFITVEYYYGFMGCLLFLFVGRRKTWVDWLMLGIPFVFTALAYYVWYRTRFYLVINNHILGASLTLYLAAIAGIWGYRTGAFTFVFPGFKKPDPDPDTEEEQKPVAPDHRPLMWGLVIVVLAFGFGYIVRAAVADPKPAQVEKLPVRAKGPVLAFGGDVGLGRRQNAITGAQGSAAALAHVPQLKAADLTVVNLEAVVATGGKVGTEKGESGSYYFRGRPELLGVLSEASVDVAVVANNHSLDYGPEALEEMFGYLDGMNIARPGGGRNLDEACAPAYRWAGDVSVAIFSVDATMPFFAATNDKPGSCFFNLAEPAKWSSYFSSRIAGARERADLVLFALHWGDNFKKRPTDQKLAVGHALIDAGADGILGSSAHKLQGIEVYKGRPIIHDAGNLLFDFGGNPSWTGVFSLVLGPHGVKQVWFEPVGSYIGYSKVESGERGGKILQRIQQRSAALGTTMHVGNHAGVVVLPPPPKRPRASTKLPPNPPAGPAPAPLKEPPTDCVATSVPADAALTVPVNVGPAKLLGAKLHPAAITERQIVYLETFWQVDAAISESLWLNSDLVSDDGLAGWRAPHETCDWQWPTNRWKPGFIYRDYTPIRPPKKKEVQSGVFHVQLSWRGPRGAVVSGPWRGDLALEVRLDDDQP